jgi:hypothetical protein
MMIPFSSRDRRRRPAPRALAADPDRAPYMPTALAFQLAPRNDGDEAADGRMGILEHVIGRFFAATATVWAAYPRTRTAR